MSQPFLGQIILVGFNFAPVGYIKCEGQTLQIAQFDALFSLIGTFYGGDGVTTFNVPDLRGRVPVHSGDSTGPGLSAVAVGEINGIESIILTSGQGVNHTHILFGDAEAGNTDKVNGTFLAQGSDVYRVPPPASVALAGGGTTIFGGSQPHENRQPFLAMTYAMATEGIFPSRN